MEYHLQRPRCSPGYLPDTEGSIPTVQKYTSDPNIGIARIRIGNDLGIDPEDTFYSAYEWCLNPYLTLRELFQRFGEELDRYSSARPAWQKEEMVINCYLFACAIICTLDDILAPRKWNLPRFNNHFPLQKYIIRIAESILNISPSLSASFARHSILRWREQWNSCGEDICRLLIAESFPDARQIQTLHTRVKHLFRIPVPESFLRRRMKIPEGFRCQDLTHHDALSMVDKFIATGIDRATPLMVIGLRTAGAYFAPLAKVYLSSRGFRDVSWTTIRPKAILSRSEKKNLRNTASNNSHILVMDDYPNSGDTILRTFSILRQFGIAAGNVTFAIPIHPVKTDVASKLHEITGAKFVILGHDELFKWKLLQPEAAEQPVREYYRDKEAADVGVHIGPETELINKQLSLHYPDGFNVRLKRVYDLHPIINGTDFRPRRIIGKSVGWGWLGYHAIIIAARLRGYVPKPLGLRNGLLFSEWIDRSPLEIFSNARIKRFSSYIADRVKLLSLREDPLYGNPEYSWGWLEMLAILRRAYGFYLGRINNAALILALRHRVHFSPTVIDGRMRPGDWLYSDRMMYKTDFEQHTFGAPELDIVDPAYDLASTIFEFELSNAAEDELVTRYEKESHDKTIKDRILVYKLLYGIVTRKKAAEFAQENISRHQQEEANRRYIRAHDFLVHTMNRFAAGAIPPPRDLPWSGKLFFMDLDGVFDSEVFTFPHTTTSGLAALINLQMNGFSVVPNTGRSVAHVSDYCSTYSLPGALGEYGSVFVDNVSHKEFGLIDRDGEDQLNRCREIIGDLPGVFLDPDYRYSIRAYRFSRMHTEGLKSQDVEKLLRANKLDRLTFISRAADTYIVQQGIDKGTGVRFVKEYLQLNGAPVAAIGDSDEDIKMLEEAVQCFAPRNCSTGIARIAKSRRWNITNSQLQKGLLSAVNSLVQHYAPPLSKDSCLPYDPDSVHGLMFRLIDVAEEPKLKKLFLALTERKIC